MKALIEDFGKQLKEALEIGANASFKKHEQNFENIMACGLGGSGIGANLVRDLIGSELKVPLIVNKNYHIPGFVNEKTFVIINSYSGNTEETLEALAKAEDKGAVINCITSGGKLAEIAAEKNYNIIKIPGGNPPRACLGYSFVQQMYVLNNQGFINDSFKSEVQGAIDLIESEKENIKSEALSIAKTLFNKITVLYAPDGYESVAVRWRQQINENGKLLCWHHIIPEMNHNELVGWRTQSDDLAVVFFDFDGVYDRIKTRKEINKTITEKYTPHIIELNANGKNKTEQMIHMIHLGDWVSYYIAEMREVDAVEVNVIDFLKSELSKR